MKLLDLIIIAKGSFCIPLAKRFSNDRERLLDSWSNGGINFCWGYDALEDGRIALCIYKRK